MAAVSDLICEVAGEDLKEFVLLLKVQAKLPDADDRGLLGWRGGNGGARLAEKKRKKYNMKITKCNGKSDMHRETTEMQKKSRDCTNHAL